ncbi:MULTISPECIES: hypothetical protein [Bacillus]|uniref:hypothetical protein n=1 Tax=Bacillus amyloliquefaciens group TaxID=1938374 RepID=UPI0039E18418
MTNLKKVLLAVLCGIILFLSVFFIGKTTGWITPSGELIQMKPAEMKEYMNKHPTGFVVLSWDQNEREIYLNHLDNVAKEKKINIRELNFSQSSIGEHDQQTQYGINSKQKLDSLAFYKNGELMGQVFFDEYERKINDLDGALNEFIQDMSQIYGLK